MPFYEYECPHCRAHTEVLQKITDKPLAKEILSGTYGPGDTVHVREKNGEILFAKS